MSVDAFIPVLWSKRYVERLKKELVYDKCYNRNYEGEIKRLGDTVRIGTVGPITISDYTKNTTNITPEIIQTDTQSLKITEAKYFDFMIDDIDRVQATPVMDEAMDEAAYGMRNTMDAFLATTLVGGLNSNNLLYNGATVSSATNPIVVGTNVGDVNAYELLVQLNTMMNLNNVPSGGRYVVVDPNFIGKMLVDARFTSFATAGAIETLKAGSTSGGEGGGLANTLRMLVGMDIYVSNNVPTDATAAPNTVYTIVAGYTGAATWADQIPITSPEAFRVQGGFEDAFKMLHLYGATIIRPRALAGAYVQYSV